MTSEQASSITPWGSVWLKPRRTIETIAQEPSRQVWLLAALGLIGNLVVQLLLGGWTDLLLDWRLLAVIVLFGAIFGIIGLYCCGILFRWSGTLFGGTAASPAIRAALAWGQMPILTAVAVYIAAVMGLRLAHGGAAVPEVWDTALSLMVVAAQLWTLVMTCLMLSRVQHFGLWRTIASSALGWLLAWLMLLLLVLPFRTFAFQPFNIPSSSMTPTLQIGDYLFVSKYSYGYTHYSLPYSPRLFSGRIFASEPQRGDVVVYRLPKDDSVDFISRIVGLPGDCIQMIQGRLHINGEPVGRESGENFRLDLGGRSVDAKRWRETLPNGVTHETLDLQETGPLDNTAEFRVPAGHYFVMGDNRDNAMDSRMQSRVGFVPLENVIGRAAFIYVSKVSDPQTNRGIPGFNRAGWVR